MMHAKRAIFEARQARKYDKFIDQVSTSSTRARKARKHAIFQTHLFV